MNVPQLLVQSIVLDGAILQALDCTTQVGGFHTQDLTKNAF
jgi:hypothetical protein